MLTRGQNNLEDYSISSEYSQNIQDGDGQKEPNQDEEMGGVSSYANTISGEDGQNLQQEKLFKVQ